MPKDDLPGPQHSKVFNALVERGMTTEQPVVICKPLTFKPR